MNDEANTCLIIVWLFNYHYFYHYFIHPRRFSIDKSDTELNLDLDFQLKVEEVTTSVAILSDFRAPLPLCNKKAEFKLPGDGSIEAFALSLGRDASQMALDIVLQQLQLQVVITISIKGA